MLYYISASGFWSALFFFVCLFCLEGFFTFYFYLLEEILKNFFFKILVLLSLYCGLWVLHCMLSVQFSCSIVSDSL